MSHLLEVKDLEVKFALRFNNLTAIDGVSFVLDKKRAPGYRGGKRCRKIGNRFCNHKSIK